MHGISVIMALSKPSLQAKIIGWTHEVCDPPNLVIPIYVFIYVFNYYYKMNKHFLYQTVFVQEVVQ